MRSPKKRKARPYRQTLRADKRDEVHQALARAAFELHDSVGPSRATISAIAARAGVQRLTVYRHFPTDEAIFAACTAYSFAEVPPPSPDAWKDIRDAELRLRTALLEFYDYYRKRTQLLSNLYRDAEMPVVAAALKRRRMLLAKATELLAEGWAVEDTRLLQAVIRHVLEFTTWRSLVEEQGLTQHEALEVASAFVRSVA